MTGTAQPMLLQQLQEDHEEERRALAEAARATGLGGNVSFEYRLISPLFDYQGLIVSAVPGADGMTATAARDSHGRQTASGNVVATS